MNKEEILAKLRVPPPGEVPGGGIIVASHNQGKLREIRDLLEPLGYHCMSAADPELGLDEPVEDGDTYEANALIKAEHASVKHEIISLSDDSGLSIDALGGDPGIHSARWAEKEDGSGRDFDLAMRRVEDALQQAGATAPEQRRARFVCVLCLSWGQGFSRFYRGEVEGTIVWPPRGDQGFGYDAIFQPDGHDRTFGEMSAEEKHGWKPGNEVALSHRARAFKLLYEAEFA